MIFVLLRTAFRLHAINPIMVPPGDHIHALINGSLSESGLISPFRSQTALRMHLAERFKKRWNPSDAKG